MLGNFSIKRVHIELGDITHFTGDAIVNAANSSLLGGGGVDGAIHRAGGPKLLEACRKQAGCATGKAKITPGFELPADYVIHAVGPVWHGGSHGESAWLASAYRSALEIAGGYRFKTIAFPSISTGAYGYPLTRAAPVALAAILVFLKIHAYPEQVTMMTYGQYDFKVYQSALTSITEQEI